MARSNQPAFDSIVCLQCQTSVSWSPRKAQSITNFCQSASLTCFAGQRYTSPLTVTRSKSPRSAARGFRLIAVRRMPFQGRAGDAAIGDPFVLVGGAQNLELVSQKFLRGLHTLCEYFL